MIRLKNLDLNKDGLKGHAWISLGDVTVTRQYTVFVAPVACRVESIDVFSQQEVSSISDVHTRLRFQLGAASGSALGARGTSASTAMHSDSILANTRYTIAVTGNNSLSTDAHLQLNVSQVGSAVMSAVMVHITYVPLKHKETV